MPQLRRIIETCSENKFSPTIFNLCKHSGTQIWNEHQKFGFTTDSWAYHSRVDDIGPGDYEPCGKTVEVLSRHVILTNDNGTLIEERLKCGHTRLQYQELIKHDSRNLQYDKLLPGQQDAVKFAEDSNINCLIQYPTGSGKTPIAATIVRENSDRLGKTLFLVQPNDKYRWQEELMEWLCVAEQLQAGEDIFHVVPAIFGKSPLMKEQRYVICTWSDLQSKQKIKWINDWGPTTLIVDESHLYKNAQSARTQGLQELLKNKSLTHKVFLSATPNMNRVSELFITLNALDPRTFSSPRVLTDKCVWVDYKPTGLMNYWKKWFDDTTSKYILRKTDEELHIPKPMLKRDKFWIDVQEYKANESFIQSYNDTLDSIDTLLQSRTPNSGQLIGLMQQLRHYVAIMKLPATIERILSFLDTYNEKITIGVHHRDVGEVLLNAFSAYGAQYMNSQSPEEKDEIEKAFKNDPERKVLIASIRGAGQGRNLQFCKNALIIERDWNKAVEDQFCGRFHRIIKDAEGRPRLVFTEDDTVTCRYMNAKGTIDEFMDAMVDLKGEIVASIEEDEEIDEMNMIKLARKCTQTRLAFVR